MMVVAKTRQAEEKGGREENETMATWVAESTPVILDTHPSPPPQVPDQRRQDDHEREPGLSTQR